MTASSLGRNLGLKFSCVMTRGCGTVSPMYPPAVIQALKEALRNVYWFERDLRLFLLSSNLHRDIVNKQDWHDDPEYKIRIVSKILDELMQLGQDGLGPVRRLIQGLLDMRTFDHLQHLEEGPQKVQMARRSVEQLRELVLQHD